MVCALVPSSARSGSPDRTDRTYGTDRTYRSHTSYLSYLSHETRGLWESLTAALAVLLEVLLRVDRPQVVQDAVSFGQDAVEGVADLVQAIAATAAIPVATARTHRGQSSLFHIASPFSVSCPSLALQACRKPDARARVFYKPEAQAKVI